MAAFFGNMDSVNLLLENGADLGRNHNHELNGFDEIVRTDNIDMLECVYDIAKKMKRNYQQVL